MFYLFICTAIGIQKARSSMLSGSDLSGSSIFKDGNGKLYSKPNRIKNNVKNIT